MAGDSYAYKGMGTAGSYSYPPDPDYGTGGNLPGVSTTNTVYSSTSYILSATGKDLVLTGTANINGWGNSLANVIQGNNANNVIFGINGADKLLGGGGNDILVGGSGRDALFGGAGTDFFDFNSPNETLPGKSRDVIRDFTTQDRIDLRTMDANSALAGNQAFTFITGTSFTGAGQIYYNASTYTLFGNIDADAAAEFEIKIYVSGSNPINALDFLL